MKASFLMRERAGLWVVDVQQKLFPLIDRPCEVNHAMTIALQGCQRMGLPIMVTEQYPQGLGPTIESLQNLFAKDQKVYAKTTFSGLADPRIRQAVLQMEVDQWILMGIEAHICVLQTAKDLLLAGKEVIVLNDAISSRSVYDFSTAIGEMRDIGVRVSSTEIVLYELLRDAKASNFKEILELVKL